MALYLLDADALIDFANRFPPTIGMLQGLLQTRVSLAVCEISVAEAYSGLAASDVQRVEELIKGCDFLESRIDAAKQAGAWRYEYARKGVALTTTDMLIAATAHAHGATVVTGNVRHFPMPELSVLPLPR